MKTKFIALMCILTTMLAGCGNMDVGPGSYTFEKVHIDIDGYTGCFELDGWRDNEGQGIEVRLKDYGAMFLSEGTYILVENECPICDSKAG